MDWLYKYSTSINRLITITNVTIKDDGTLSCIVSNGIRSSLN